MFEELTTRTENWVNEGIRPYMAKGTPGAMERTGLTLNEIEFTGLYPRKSPHAPVRNLQAIIRSSLQPDYKRQAVMRACRGFLGQRQNNFADVAQRTKGTYDFYDIGGYLTGVARGFGLQGYASRIQYELKENPVNK